MDLMRNEILGQCLQKVRLERNLSQRQLAELLGKQQPFISKVETGERKLSAIELFEFVIALEGDYTIIAEEIRSALTAKGKLPQPDDPTDA